ncbi:HAS subgroup protein [Tanacetum coccineum]|uniref:HAS subgroup protein n=1 Tax=Tanacetum coccineum TaxID=301880 RepID=A0ABQ5G1R6_9ASTR
MGGGIDGRLGISSTLTLPRSSDLERTQVELRQTFTAAEKYRIELEFLQKGGNPLDLKFESAASVSVQSTSLTDQHQEPFVTSEPKGSFAVTASPYGDSVGSSRDPSVCEPNSADSLVLFDGGNKFPEAEKRSIAPSDHYSQLDSGKNTKKSGDPAALGVPRILYKRRVRSRPNRDGGRSSSSRDVKGLVVAASENGNAFSSFDSNLKGSNASVTIKDIVSSGHLDTELNGVLAEETTLRQVISTNCSNSELPGTQIGQSLDVSNEDELPARPRNVRCNGTMEQVLAFNEVPGKEGNDLVQEKECNILNIASNNIDSCCRSNNEDGLVLKEVEAFKGSELDLQIELKNPGSVEEIKPDGPTDIPEQSACSQNNLNLAIKEHEDYILKQAQIIEVNRKRMTELDVSTLPLQNCQISHWDLVLEEMSWLANDFAQERLWKVSAAAQVSRQVALSSQKRYQLQIASRKQKEVAQTLSRDVMEFWHTIEVKCKDLDLQSLKTDSKKGLQGYAMRFLKYNSILVQCSTMQVPSARDMTDLGIIDIAWDKLTEENLFYTVPPGAIEAYRKSIESHLLQCEKTWTGMPEEVDTSGRAAVAGINKVVFSTKVYQLQKFNYVAFGSKHIVLEEDDGGTRAFELEVSNTSKAIKSRREDYKSFTERPYEMGADLPFMQANEKNTGIQPSVYYGKRPCSSLNVILPTKHVRAASSQRVVGPFSAETSSYIQAPNNTDASSGDTNSSQDEQILLHGGAQIPDNIEAGSVDDYAKQFQFHLVDMSDRPRKKKKAKHSGASFNHRWPLDSVFQNDQKDHSKRRLDAYHLDSNGGNGLCIQRNTKKLKIRELSNNSSGDFTPLPRSIPSPVTPEMSDMANRKKFMDLHVPDCGKRSKTLKIPVCQPGSGSPWPLFEDQSLVVLVHDIGPNWGIISDAFNSSLRFKSIFRSSKECKERHKMLMDRSAGDGGDSSEDSGSSQPYPSTLPGIPEGSARQLFQRLQGPMEEDTLKSNFEKIIKIGKKHYYGRRKKDKQGPKHLQQPHSSHALALSRVSPNNLKGGLSSRKPMDFCDAIEFTPDVPAIGYQVSSSSTLCSDFSLASVPLNPPNRDWQHSNLSPGSLSGTDRGVRMLAAENGTGVMPGMNRSTPIARPGFDGAASPSMAMLSPIDMQSMVGPGQGSSMLRPKQSTDRRMQDLPVSQGGSSQGAPQLPNGMSLLPNQSAQPLDRPHSHELSSNSNNRKNLKGPCNQALRMRLIKEKQLWQQRVLQQQQFPQPPKFQLPVTSAPNSTHIQPQSSPPVFPSGLVHQILKQQNIDDQFVSTSQMQAASSKKLLHQKADNNYQNNAPRPVAFSSSVPSNNQQLLPQTRQNLLNLSRGMVNNQLVKSPEPPTNNSQTSLNFLIPQVPCTSVGATSETF